MRGNLGYVGAWVGQIFTRVDWVTWVKILFTWVIIFAWVKCIFVWVFECVLNFCVHFFLCGSAFLTRWDYFSILQLMNWAFFSWDSSQKILTKLCLTPLVFLNGLIETCKIDEIQWHFYEHMTKFYLWAANWPYSQRRCE